MMPTELGLYAGRFDTETLPRTHMPEEGMPAQVAHQSVKDLRSFDRNPRLNMASYVTTYMESEAIDLIVSSLNVNLADSEIYPSSTDMHNRCMAMLSDLWNAPDPEHTAGTATVGSSEACMLGSLNLKKRWQDARRAAGKPTDRPNIVLGYNCQVCWEKFAAHYDVEPRFAHMREGAYVMQPDDLWDLVDENTIGVAVILGSTYTGHYEDVKGMNAVLDAIHKQKGFDVHMHIDGASGAFVAPFLTPEMEWDFRQSRVASISASGHKYGMVYPGVGWLVWRHRDLVHKSLDFHLAYLGSDEETITINFSRPACFVVAQYYQFLRLGKSGYRTALQNMQAVATKLAEGLKATGHFNLLNEPSKGIPMVAFVLLNKKTAKDEQADAGEGASMGNKPRQKPATQGGARHYTEYDIADKMKEWGWMVPAYTLAPDLKHITAMRCVIRVDMSITIIEELLKDINLAVQYLDKHDELLFATGAGDAALKNIKHAKSHPRHRRKHHIIC